jgi:hypothetical protein
LGFGSVGGLRRTVNCVPTVPKRRYSLLISCTISNLCAISLLFFKNILRYLSCCFSFHTIAGSDGRSPMSWNGRYCNFLCSEIFMFPTAVDNLSQNNVCEILLTRGIPDMIPTCRCYSSYCLQVELKQNLSNNEIFPC